MVMIGWENNDYDDRAARIVKMDWQGNILWDTAIPFRTKNPDMGRLQKGLRMAGDDGYLAMYSELGTGAAEDDYERFNALIRFSSAGRILWMKEEFENKYPDFGLWDMIGYRDRYVLHYYNALGSDFTVGLCKGHIWCAGGEFTPKVGDDFDIRPGELPDRIHPTCKVFVDRVEWTAVE